MILKDHTKISNLSGPVQFFFDFFILFQLFFPVLQIHFVYNKHLKTRASLISSALEDMYPVDTGRKLNVNKTFRRRPGCLMYVQFTSCVYGVGCVRRNRTGYFSVVSPPIQRFYLLWHKQPQDTQHRSLLQPLVVVNNQVVVFQ